MEAMRQLFAHGGHKRVFQGRGVAALDRILRDRDDGPDVQARWLQAGEGGSFPCAVDTDRGREEITIGHFAGDRVRSSDLQDSLRGAHDRPIERVTVWWHCEYSCPD